MKFIFCISLLVLIGLAGWVVLEYQANAPAIAAAQAETARAAAQAEQSRAIQEQARAQIALASVPKTLAWVGLLLVIAILLAVLILTVIFVRSIQQAAGQTVIYYLPPGSYPGHALPERTNQDDYLDSGLQFGWLRGPVRRPLLRGRWPRV